MHKNPKNAHKNAQKRSKNFKPSIHNVVSTGTNFSKNVAFCVPIGCVRFASYCGKMYRRHLFSYGGLVHALACVYRVYMDARGKFGEHEKGVSVIRGAAESNSSFSSADQTMSQLFYNIIIIAIQTFLDKLKGKFKCLWKKSMKFTKVYLNEVF